MSPPSSLLKSDPPVASHAHDARSAPMHLGLRNVGFDRWFILGIPAVALTSLLVVLAWPSTFFTVLTLDLWLLGYHHVIATYTRIGMDRESFARYWALLFLLPIGVACIVFTIGLTAGADTLTTLYFYWLWFHYVRQSEGISKAYAARGGIRDAADQTLHRLSFYLVPTASLLQLTSFGSGKLLGFDVSMLALPIPAMFMIWGGAFAIAAISLYQLRRLIRDKGASKLYLTYICSHYLVFVTTYGMVDDVSTAWLGLNIWHNLQYLTFVWLSHDRRFKGSVNGKAKLLSTLALPKNVWMYVLGCLAITFVFYMGVRELLAPIQSTLGTSALLAAALAYQTINFHHYIVDALIWRKPKTPSAARHGVDAASA